MRAIFSRFRIRDPLLGTLYGSFATVLLLVGRTWLEEWGAAGFQILESIEPKIKGPLIAAMLALLLLLVPRFWHKSACLIRSWRAGIVRGSILVSALASVWYWAVRTKLLIFVAVIVAFELVCALEASRRKPRTFSPQQISTFVPRHRRTSLTAVGFDKPIQAWDEDAVGRQDFVETILTRVLVNGEPAIGITADFGEGKSSVLHLLQTSIENSRMAIVVPFRTWLPGNEATFVDSLFGTAAAAIRTRFFLPSWRSTFRRYGRVVLGVMPKSWEFLKDLLPPDSQSDQIAELTALFSRLPLRVVFLLDEIDRMHEGELTVLLKILRGAPELSNVSYICAFNKEALARVISPDAPQFGCDYLDKFFPVQLPLPRIDEDLRECLFSDRLSEILKNEAVLEEKQFADMRNSLWYDALEGRLTNFRAIGQLLRGFQSSLHVLKSEVDVFDLLVIESIRMQLPSTYEFIYQNGRYFHDPPGGVERWARAPHLHHDDEIRKKEAASALDAFFKDMDAADQELARELLVRVFPSVKEYFKKVKGLDSFIIQSRERDRRISQPNYFPRYFVYAVPATMFGEAEMDSFVASLRDADQEVVKSSFEATLPGDERDDLRRIHFLRRLTSRASEIPDPQARWLAIALAQRTATMLSTHVAYLVVRGLVFTLAARFQGTPQFQS